MHNLNRIVALMATTCHATGPQERVLKHERTCDVTFQVRLTPFPTPPHSSQVPPTFVHLPKGPLPQQLQQLQLVSASGGAGVAYGAPHVLDALWDMVEWWDGGLGGRWGVGGGVGEGG